MSNLSTVVSPSLASLLTQVKAVKFDGKKPIQLQVQNMLIFYMLQQCKEFLPLCLPNKQAKGKCCNGKSTEVKILASPFCTFTVQFSCLLCNLVGLFSSLLLGNVKNTVQFNTPVSGITFSQLSRR